MAIDINQLKTELQTDPTNQGYAPLLSAGNDSGVAAQLNIKQFSARAPIKTVDIKRHAIQNGYWAALKGAAAAHPDAQVRGAATCAIDYASDTRLETMDLDLPASQAMLNGLVAAGLISTAQHDELVAMGNINISRAEQLFGIGTQVSADDISRTRS
jgi:hypothetical protein